MSEKDHRRTCAQCTRQTASTTGLCWQCRPCPTVELSDGLVQVDGLPPLTVDKALQLAHRIADAVAP